MQIWPFILARQQFHQCIFEHIQDREQQNKLGRCMMIMIRTSRPRLNSVGNFNQYSLNIFKQEIYLRFRDPVYYKNTQKAAIWRTNVGMSHVNLINFRYCRPFTASNSLKAPPALRKPKFCASSSRSCIKRIQLL
jgi:hypothetical protein